MMILVELDLFYSKVQFGPSVFVWENAYAVDFQNTNEACEVEGGTFSQINEYMMIYDNPRSRSFIDFCPRSLRYNIFKLLFFKTQISYGASKGHWDDFLFQIFWVTLPRWLPGLYMVKTFKQFLLRNQEADDLETWYTATGIQLLIQQRVFNYCEICSNDDTFLTLTIFMAWSNLFSNASTWMKAYTERVNRGLTFGHGLSPTVPNFRETLCGLARHTKRLPTDSARDFHVTEAS